MLGGREKPVLDILLRADAKGHRPLANPAGPRAAGSHPARPQGAGDNGPSASLRDDSDNGPCPAMPIEPHPDCWTGVIHVR